MRARIGYYDQQKQTFTASLHGQAKEADKLEPKGKRTGYGFPNWLYVNVAPPVYKDGSEVSVVTYAERGKPVYPPYRQAKPQGTL